MTLAKVYEPHEWIRIETGIPGDAQESDFMNGTLQGTGNGDDFEFTVQTHIGCPPGIESEEQLVEHLMAVLEKMAAAADSVAFSVQTGPFGRGDG